MIRRREFMTLLGGAATWPLTADAQPRERIRRIGVLMPYAADEPEAQARIAALHQGLQPLGWTIGRNVRIEYRWAPDMGQLHSAAAELVAVAPDVILANAPATVVALQQATRTMPIVFAAVTDPVGLGIVRSLARPGGNTTGFANAEFGTSAKWLELLKEIAPNVTRAAVIQEPGNPGSSPQFSAIQSVAPVLRVDLSTVFFRDPDDFQASIGTFAREANGGLIVARTNATIAHRDSIIKLAAQHRLPSVYPLRLFTADGGLLSYGPDIVEQFRLAAGYVDRILKGEKSTDLPVQAPTKHELVVNIKTARALGIEIPATLLARADEVIE
jgi:putative ABC transport system substrate-binding protein